jgi:signal transduction histidine kinase
MDLNEKRVHNITEVSSVISHQLKTPLAAIKSSLEVLLSGDLGDITKEQRDYVEVALTSSQRMIDLVKDFLDASRIEENKFQIHKERVDLVHIVTLVVDGLKMFADAKNTSITLQSEDNIPHIMADPTKIQEVINNLIINAVRYSRGKGLVNISLKKEGDSVLFSCKDAGVGISPEEKDKIFSKYYRGQRGVALSPDGTGLGLFISKAIVEQSGGRIWYESEVDKGTTFYFTLPIQ